MRDRNRIAADREKRLQALKKLKTKAQKRQFIKLLLDALQALRNDVQGVKVKTHGR